MNELNEYPVPDEIAVFFFESIALEDVRNRYIRMPFGYKKAVKAAVGARKSGAAFWQAIYTLYPEINAKDQWTFSPAEMVIRKTP